MRTRIALVAIVPIALITVSTLTQAALAPSARAESPSSFGTASSAVVTLPANQLAAYVSPATTATLDLGGQPFASISVQTTVASTATVAPAPVPVAAPAPAPVAVDTVTPSQRAAWERVAECEEGGDWTAENGRFSGGLGISRTNWAAYGGDEFASEGAQATEDQQIMVAERIQSNAPDQYGCHGW